MRVYIIFYLLLLLSCKTERDDNCNVLFNKAKASLNNYYEKKDANYLKDAKIYLDSIGCDSFKHKIFNTKTSILLLSKNYLEGVNYISSIDSASFDRSYMKSMYLNRFKALESESKSDTVHRDQYYIEGLSEICLYINKHPSDKDALFDYYMFKIFFNDRTDIIKEIESLKSRKMYEDDFLDAIIETLHFFDEYYFNDE